MNTLKTRAETALSISIQRKTSTWNPTLYETQNPNVAAYEEVSSPAQPNAPWNPHAYETTAINATSYSECSIGFCTV
ncbi:MAG: hypothetical protein MRQ07_03220 [Candidatus Midichloria sp.]|nr:hypothetical protein [Candidatus Midichloria sp.]